MVWYIGKGGAPGGPAPAWTVTEERDRTMCSTMSADTVYGIMRQGARAEIARARRMARGTLGRMAAANQAAYYRGRAAWIAARNPHAAHSPIRFPAAGAVRG